MVSESTTVSDSHSQPKRDSRARIALDNSRVCNNFPPSCPYPCRLGTFGMRGAVHDMPGDGSPDLPHVAWRKFVPHLRMEKDHSCVISDGQLRSCSYSLRCAMRRTPLRQIQKRLPNWFSK